jgi:hypothetical protein
MGMLTGPVGTITEGDVLRAAALSLQDSRGSRRPRPARMCRHLYRAMDGGEAGMSAPWRLD